MLTEKELVNIAANALIDEYGREYLQKTYDSSCTAKGMVTDDIFMFFLGIKDKFDMPNRVADDHGWVVSGTIYIDANSGKIVQKICTKE